MSAAGVPILPGTGVIETDRDAEEAVERIGLPVIIKASAGGGGRGMKIVEDRDRLQTLLAQARSEAQAGFGNPNGLHRALHRAGPATSRCRCWATATRAIALGERECSIQRRHQKLVEEAPSVALDDARRAELLGIARKATQAIGYKTVGTLEFLLDEDKSFYFMEMNTRIQVEHTVTEEVFGVDLVREQMRLAAGEPLRIGNDIRPRGHAIELRINAEDPVTFAPSPGRITALNLPGGLGVRIDTHIYTNYVVPTPLRLAAGQADRPRREPAGVPGAPAPRARRVRRRGLQDQPRLSPPPARERRLHRVAGWTRTSTERM